MLLLIDNYDSFVHTLARYCRELGAAARVVRNDAVTAADLDAASAVLLSPGPCGPAESGVCREVVRDWDGPILGVCLGHQAIVDAIGGRVGRGERPVHGRASAVRHDRSRLFAGVPDEFPVGRYHSLVAHEVPAELRVTATLAESPEVVMAVEHHKRPVFGVQFHPESVLTPHGRLLLGNFLDLAGFVRPASSNDQTVDRELAGLFEADQPAGADFYARPSQPAYPLPPAR